jgi:hypothetical protein
MTSVDAQVHCEFMSFCLPFYIVVLSVWSLTQKLFAIRVWYICCVKIAEFESFVLMLCI